MVKAYGRPIQLILAMLFATFVLILLKLDEFVRGEAYEDKPTHYSLFGFFFFGILGLLVEALAQRIPNLIDIRFFKHQLAKEALEQDYQDPELTENKAQDEIENIMSANSIPRVMINTAVAFGLGGAYVTYAGMQSTSVILTKTGTIGLQFFASFEMFRMKMSLLKSLFNYFRDKTEENNKMLDLCLQGIDNTAMSWKIIKSPDEDYNVLFRIFKSYSFNSQEHFYSLNLDKDKVSIKYSSPKINLRISSELFLIILSEVLARNINNMKIIASDAQNFVMSLPSTYTISNKEEEIKQGLQNCFEQLNSNQKRALNNARELNKYLQSKFILIFENTPKRPFSFNVEFKLFPETLETNQNFLEKLLELFNEEKESHAFLQEKEDGCTSLVIKNFANFDKSHLKEIIVTSLPENDSKQVAEDKNYNFSNSHSQREEISDDIKIAKKPRWLVHQSPIFWRPSATISKQQTESPSSSRTILPPKDFRGWVVHCPNNSISLIERPAAKSKVNIEDINDIAMEEATDDTPGVIRMARNFGQNGLKKRGDIYELKDRTTRYRIFLEERPQQEIYVDTNRRSVPTYIPIKGVNKRK